MAKRPPKPTTAVRRVNASTLARELGVRPQAISDLIKRGRIDRGPDMLIDAEKAKASIAEKVRAFGKTAAAVTAKQKTPATPGLAGPSAPSPDVLSYQTARANREQEEAQTARIKRLQLERRLIDREATLAAIYTAFRTLRDQAMPVGRRVAARVATMTDARDVQDLIDAELRLVFQQFAEKTLATAAGRIAGPDAKPAERDWIDESTKEPA